jgi:hypothetical protein
MPKNNIIPQMFDVRPVKKTGDLDWEKIQKVAGMRQFSQKKVFKKAEPIQKEEKITSLAESRRVEPTWQKARMRRIPRKPKVSILGQKFESEEWPIFSAPAEVLSEVKEEIIEAVAVVRETVYQKPKLRINYSKIIRKYTNSILRFIAWPFFLFLSLFNSIQDIVQKLFKKIMFVLRKIAVWPVEVFDSLTNFFQTIFPQRKNFSFSWARNFTSFSLVAGMIIFAIGGVAFWNKGIFVQGKVLGVSQEGLSSVNGALASLKNQDFEGSIAGFTEANLKFSEASAELSKMGSFLIESSRFVPFASKLSSGKNVIEAGKYLALAGEDLVKTAQMANALKENGELKEISFLDVLSSTEKNLERAGDNLKRAEENISKVNVGDLPEDKKEKFVLLKSNLPTAILAVDAFLENEQILRDLLGGNGPRKFLFLFQNNQEMRATGGFIGSYGLLDISNGRVRNFFIDGIFNPDGQLQEKVVPPLPIQKVSAAWSLHDSNWFPDFPTSAKEAIVFYEKTGGPTTDGVFTLTPTVLQKLLEITGPIEMKEYDVVLDSKNFVEKTQYEVEVDYDKVENKPKKILSDLAPIILDKLFSAKDLKTIVKTLDVMVEALNQKQILIFSQNQDLQKMISKEGWSGEVLPSQGDYVSVINTNINGFKTDGVISEKIEHEAEIQNDGTVVDTLTITRKHNGGNTGFSWWDKVNADYLRVYLPLGAKFLSVEGQTREFNKSPLDYDALNFQRDSEVEKEETGIQIDEATGTRVYEDFGKTVFANWTYVSPGETMTIKYRYELPFKISFENGKKEAASYSLLAQKQSGSLGSDFSSKIIFPRKFKVNWKYPEDGQEKENELQLTTDLSRDRFWGAIFTEKNLIINE